MESLEELEDNFASNTIIAKTIDNNSKQTKSITNLKIQK